MPHLPPSHRTDPMADATAHMRALHLEESRCGQVAVARRLAVGQRRWYERAVDRDELEPVARRYARAATPDVYISQNRFRGWRRIVLLAEIGAVWVDLDTYRDDCHLAGRCDLTILHAILHRCDDGFLAPPSYVLSTGRGTVAVWIHESLPLAALPRWQAVQQHLCAYFQALGADRNAIDAARVLRLVGTVNSRADGVPPVRLVWPTTRWPVRHHFEVLAEAVLPYSRPQMQALQAQRAKAKAAKRTPRAGSRSRPSRDARTLCATRLADLRTLCDLRHDSNGGILPPGERDAWMLIAASMLAHLVHPQQLDQEVAALAHLVTGGHWTAAETRERMGAVLARARDAALGRTIEYCGVERDPRYRWRTNTIIERLKITPAEQAHMRELVEPDEKRKRKRERDRTEKAARRAPGQQARAKARADATARARALARTGLSQRAIAHLMGTSQTTVRRALDGGNPRPSADSPVIS